MEQADVDLIGNLARQHRLSAAWKLKASSAFAKADPVHKEGYIRFSQEDQVDILNELIGGGVRSRRPRESTSVSWWWPASWLRPAAPLGPGGQGAGDEGCQQQPQQPSQQPHENDNISHNAHQRACQCCRLALTTRAGHAGHRHIKQLAQLLISPMLAAVQLSSAPLKPCCSPTGIGMTGLVTAGAFLMLFKAVVQAVCSIEAEPGCPAWVTSSAALGDVRFVPAWVRHFTAWVRHFTAWAAVEGLAFTAALAMHGASVLVHSLVLDLAVRLGMWLRFR